MKDLLYAYNPKTGTHDNVFDPLGNDADAFKLMVDARLNVILLGDAVQVEYLGKALNIGRNEGSCKGDLYGAVRRAIVIAAARIGSEIP